MIGLLSAMLVVAWFLSGGVEVVAGQQQCSISVRPVGSYIDGDRIIVDYDAELTASEGRRWSYSFFSRVRFRVDRESGVRENVESLEVSGVDRTGVFTHTFDHICHPIRDCVEIVSVRAEQTQCSVLR